MTDITLFDFGGSIVAPDKPDTVFLGKFLPFFKDWLEEKPSRRAILVVGGGGAARAWQGACRELVPQMQAASLDWVGVAATRLNAELLRALLGDLSPDPVVTDPTADFSFTGRVLMAAGWKPGFSTDYDAVLLAERFEAERILMLSNITQIYSADPKIDPQARPLEKLTWDEYKALSQKTWTPGANVPFDPVATRKAAEKKLTVIAAAGRDLDNLKALLEGRDFVGTVISP